MQRRRLNSRWIAAGSLVAATGCLEPNPNAADGMDGSSTDSTTEPGTSDTGTGGTSDFAFNSLSFEVGATETFSIPKPDQPHTVPFATITNYAPAVNAESLGYAMVWTDVGDAYELELSLSGVAGNSKVGGVAVVFGFADELGAPEVQEVQVTADNCGSVSLADLGDRVMLDAVERYEPGAATQLSYARTAGASLEYCITGADAPEASLAYKVVMVSLPEGVVSLEIPELVLSSNMAMSADYSQLGAATQIVHLIGARGFDEGSEASLGYQITCSAQSPFGCDYDLIRFKAGARVVAGGSIIAIQ